jgi:AraC-like DNA-binding protein
MVVYFFYSLVGLLGLITTTIVFIQHKSNRTINLYLILLFCVISIRFLLETIFYFYKNLIPNFSYFPFFTIIIPLFHLYIKNIIANTKQYKLKELWHLMFPLVLSFGNLLNNYYSFLGKYSVVILNIIFVIYAVIYLVFGFLLLKKNVWNRNSKIQVIDVQNNLLHKWTLFLFILYVAISLRLILTLFLDLINSSFSAGKNQLWISGILWSIIFIKILITPEILFGYNALYKKINEQKKSEFSLNDIWNLKEKIEINNLQDNLLKNKIYPELTKYLKDIEYLALTEKWFRKSKTSATEVAKKLNMPESHLKFVFKYHSKVSLSEFKKIIKIYDALQLIETGFLKINTLDALAIKVGFSSYNPFFTSFKDVTGSTPQAYNKQIVQDNKLKN